MSSFTDITDRVNAEREQASLTQLTTLVASHAEPRCVFDAIAHEAAASFGAVAGGVVRFDEGRTFGTLVGASLTDPSVEPPYATRVDLGGHSAIGEVARTGEPVLMSGERGACLTVPGFEAAAVMATPLSVDHALWGTLVVAFSEARALSQQELRRLNRLGEIATLAIVSSHDGPRTAVSPPGPSDLLPGRLRRQDAPELGHAPPSGVNPGA